MCPNAGKILVWNPILAYTQRGGPGVPVNFPPPPALCKSFLKKTTHNIQFVRTGEYTQFDLPLKNRGYAREPWANVIGKLTSRYLGNKYRHGKGIKHVITFTVESCIYPWKMRTVTCRNIESLSDRKIKS